MRTLILFISWLLTPNLFAQDGSLDLSFDPGSGFDLLTKTIAIQPDGKVLVGGWFSEFDGVPRGGIARLNTDGSLDVSFNPGSGANQVINSVLNPGQVNEILVQPDGKILVGGYFSHYNGIERHGLARLNTDGALDLTFDPGIGLPWGGMIYEMILQPDGKVIIGGNFQEFDGTGRKSIARINSDGSLDLGFHPTPSISFVGQISALELQPDGKILVGGLFDSFESSQCEDIVRLNPNGSIDQSFDCGTGVNAYGIEDFALLPNGNIMITGQYTEVNGNESIMISRLLSNGNLDNSFVMDTTINWNAGTALELQPDGKIILAGWNFTWQNGQNTAISIVRLNSDGSIDHTFDPGTGVHGTLWDVKLQADGKILLVGAISHVNGIPRNFVARLNNSSISSTSEREFSHISISPNPATEEFHVTYNRNLVGKSVSIYSIDGKLIDEKNYTQVVNVSSLSEGTYIVKLLFQDGTKVFDRLVVQ